MGFQEKVEEIRDRILYDTKAKEKKLDSLLADLLNLNDTNQIDKILPLIYGAVTNVESVYIRTGKSPDLSKLYRRLTETFEKSLAKFKDSQNTRAIEILLEHYKKLFLIYNNMANTIDQDRLSDRARSAAKDGKYDEAINLIDKALAHQNQMVDQPSRIVNLYEKAAALKNKSSNEEALKIYKELTELDPKGTAWFNVGYLYSDVFHRFEDALPYYEKYVDLYQSDEKGLIALGRTNIELRNYGDALTNLNKALAIDPKDSSALRNKAYALLMLGRDEEAVYFYTEALETDPHNADLWNNKGWSLRNLGRHKEAIECFDKTLEIDKNHPFALRNKGRSLHEMGNTQEAMVIYNNLLHENPHDLDTLIDKAMMILDLGKLNEAIELYDEALTIEPENYIALANKGVAYIRNEDYNMAVMILDKVISLKPDYSLGYYNRACALALRGDNIEKVLTDLRRAIEMDKKCINLAKQDKDFEPIRSDENFQQLILDK
jgi:tetratricopeptide (TPR) repeat protein